MLISSFHDVIYWVQEQRPPENIKKTLYYTEN